MDISSLGWRDLILLLVVLAAVYLAFVLLKLIQVGRKGQHGVPPVHADDDLAEPVMAEPMPRMSAGAPAAQGALSGEPLGSASRGLSAYEEMAASAAPEPFAVPPAPTFEWSEVKELFGEEPASPPASSSGSSVPDKRSGGFGEHLSEHLVRSDMEMEIQRMRDEMARMKQELEELRAARRVSPQYAEAMDLAQRGLSAQDMADRLGISLAEAELVHALSRGRKNFDEGDDDGGESGASAGPFDGSGRR